MIKKIGERKYQVKITADTNILKMVLPVGSMSKHIPVGYAHFIEHLIIRNNHELLATIEKAGGWFNATTKEDNLEFLIYDIPDPLFTKLLDDDYIANLFKMRLTDNDLENEKKTVLNEFQLLISSNDKQYVSNSIGDEQAIMNFNMAQVKNILQENNQVWLYYYTNFDDQLANLVQNDHKPNEIHQQAKLTDDNQIKIYFTDDDERQSLMLLLELLKASDINFGHFTLTDEYLGMSQDEYELLTKNITNIKNRFDILMNLSFSKYSAFTTSLIGKLSDLETLSTGDLEKAWQSCYDA